jgi:outer membrane biosynthesis protein TonB
VKVKIDKTVAASIALHLLVLGWGLVTFSSRAFVAPPDDSVDVDTISPEELSKITAGSRAGKKEDTAQRVEKIAEAKASDEVGKVDPKKQVVTDAAPAVQEKPVEKPAEKPTPTPPKPVVEDKPKPDKAKDEKIDPIGDLAKKELAKKPPAPKPVAVKPTPPPQQTEKKERKFDELARAALVSQEDPTRAAATGSAMNASNKLGAFNRSDAENSAGWKSAFQRRVRQCFNFPYNGIDADTFEVDLDISIRPDGTITAQPVIAGVRGASPGIAKAVADAAARAVVECQPYSFLPKEQYASWKFIPTTFGLKDMR